MASRRSPISSARRSSPFCCAIRRRRSALPRAKAGEPAAPLAKARIEPAILGGIIGVTLIFTAVSVRTVTIPLLITSTLKGSYADLGIFAGLAAALELPFMVAWGYALRWVSKHTIIICGALLYAVYLVLISRATSVTEVLWLQLLNGPATAALHDHSDQLSAGRHQGSRRAVDVAARRVPRRRRVSRRRQYSGCSPRRCRTTRC